MECVTEALDDDTSGSSPLTGTHITLNLIDGEPSVTLTKGSGIWMAMRCDAILRIIIHYMYLRNLLL